MKYCPQCQKQYTENWITFCSEDGTILIDTGYSPSPNPPPAGGQRPPYAPPLSEQPTWHAQDPNWRSPDPNAPGSWVPHQPPQPVRPAWQPPPPPSAYPRQSPQSSGFAIASMILGILSLGGMFCLGPLPGIAALVLGLVALSQIKSAPDKNGGKPLAIVGIATGALSMAIFGVWLIIVIIANVAG